MAAELGNNYAEKWTLTEATALINSVLQYVEANDECYSLTEALVNNDGYDDLLNYLQKKFPVPEVFRPIKKAKDIVKARLISGGAKGKTNPTMSIFILKNNHGMEDRHTLEAPATVLRSNALVDGAKGDNSVSED